jgi:predicted  nucleic acid-binding Zn-ribbon protein
MELAKAREDLEQRDKRITELEAKLKEMNKQIEKYEIFVDICNQRVMYNRGKLAAELDLDPGLVAGGDANAASNA